MMFSRANPSPRYQSLIELYRQMHVEGDRINNIPAAETFNGGSLKPHVLSIAELLKRTDSKSLLDYGAGKGEGYKNLVATLPDGSRVTGQKNFWGIDEKAYPSEPGLTTCWVCGCHRQDVA